MQLDEGQEYAVDGLEVRGCFSFARHITCNRQCSRVDYPH